MAKARTKREQEPVKPAMVKHIQMLGLDSAEDYLAWCVDRGFEASFSKSSYDRADEISALGREIERARERQQIHRNPRKFLERVCAGEVSPEEINRPGWSEVCEAIQASRPGEAQRQSLCAFLVQIERRSDLLFASVGYGRRTLLYIDGLIRLHDRRKQWIRPLEDWQPGSHNLRRQFSSLVRHLLARYPVPGFMDSSWLRRDAGSYRFRDWFIHIGRGKNIRTARTLFPMTKKMSHHFLCAPDHYSIEEALTWGEVHALGGDKRLTEAILGTRLGDRVERDEEKRAFWSSVYKFFISNPMLDRRHVGPIIDYLDFQKFEPQEVMTGPGQVERRPPPQPNLSMNRRTPESLLRQVERWHGELQTYRLAADRFFRSSGHSGLLLETGPKDAAGRRAQWRIRELLSGAELVEEGRKLKHCVASYASSCAKGHCSIWTLEWISADGDIKKHLTLELDKNGVLVEARGLQNRFPTAQEVGLLQIWAREAGLSMDRIVYD